jgi:hypothetical protein
VDGELFKRMKRFSDNYQPVEIELVDNAGQTITLKSKFLTQKDWLDVNGIAGDDKATLNCKVMAKVFGGDPVEYMKYSSDILKETIDYYYSQLGKNPQKAQGS